MCFAACSTTWMRRASRSTTSARPTGRRSYVAADAITVAMDMTEGITAWFRTMAVSRAAVLAGHVLGSGFEPTGSMPAWMQLFAEYQPFTPFIETIRGLLLGTPLGWSPALAVGWSAVIALVGYVWSLVIYERKSVH
jgi:ABC-type multidrug transport system permease subunit